MRDIKIIVINGYMAGETEGDGYGSAAIVLLTVGVAAAINHSNSSINTLGCSFIKRAKLIPKEVILRI